MNKQKKITIGVILLAVLLMGIGYAAITNITLTINGTASATADQENFKVYFTGVVVSNSDNATSTVTANSTNATVNFAGMTTKDDEEYAILEIENGSNNIPAQSVNVTLSDTDTSIIEVNAVMCNSTGTPISEYAVASGNKTYVRVSAKLLKTPTEDVNTPVTVNIVAVPKDA